MLVLGCWADGGRGWGAGAVVAGGCTAALHAAPPLLAVPDDRVHVAAASGDEQRQPAIDDDAGVGAQPHGEQAGEIAVPAGQRGAVDVRFPTEVCAEVGEVALAVGDDVDSLPSD